MQVYQNIQGSVAVLQRYSRTLSITYTKGEGHRLLRFHLAFNYYAGRSMALLDSVAEWH